jgi:plasmid replication initiation protein
MVPAEEKPLELKKHVGLIHSVNKLSLLERKIANALLYNAYDNLQAQNEHEVHIPSLCKLIGYNSKDDKTIKKALVSLISTVLEWNLIDQEKMGKPNTWVTSAMLSDAKIEGPICTYSYSNRMRELCYYPEFYGRLNMEVLSTFRSTYGLALYENCIRYQGISQTPWFDMATYRKLMGVSDGKYEIFRDFNRRVIKPAVKEVNERSPIFVEPELRREGRVVTGIRFKICKGLDKLAQQKSLMKQVERSVEDRLGEDYGFSVTQIKLALKKYEESYLLEKMRLIESSTPYQEGRIKNLARYLEKALEDNYQPPKSSRENLSKLKVEQEKAAGVRAQREKNMHRYKSYQTKNLPGLYNNLPKKEKERVTKEFEKYLGRTVYSEVYMKEGMDNPLVKDRFGDFVRRNHTSLLASLLSFEDFCKREKI